MKLCSMAEPVGIDDVSAPESIDFTNLFQSESVGTCQPVGHKFKVSVLAITPVLNIPFAAYQLYKNP